MSLAKIKKFTDNRLTMNDAMDELLSKLDVGEIDKRYNVVIAESGKIDIIKKSNPMQP